MRAGGEKIGIQALDRTQPILPMRPGQVGRRSHDYVRNGITDLFAALNLATGEVIHQLRPQHRAAEFKKFLATIDKVVPAELEGVRRSDGSAAMGKLKRPFLAHRERILQFAIPPHPWWGAINMPRRGQDGFWRYTILCPKP